jgi:hypothetical protein
MGQRQKSTKAGEISMKSTSSIKKSNLISIAVQGGLQGNTTAMPYISQSSRYSSTSQLDRNILKAAASEIAKLRN